MSKLWKNSPIGLTGLPSQSQQIRPGEERAACDNSTSQRREFCRSSPSNSCRQKGRGGDYRLKKGSLHSGGIGRRSSGFRRRSLRSRQPQYRPSFPTLTNSRMPAVSMVPANPSLELSKDWKICHLKGVTGKWMCKERIVWAKWRNLLTVGLFHSTLFQFSKLLLSGYRSLLQFW